MDCPPSYAIAKNDLLRFIDLIETARTNSGKTFAQITGSICTECACRPPALLTSAACKTAYENVVSLLNAAAGMSVPAISDPWGNPYLFNENEGEVGCHTDNILTAGPDGIYCYPCYTTADNVVVNIPVFACSPSLGSHHPDENWP